MAKKPKKRFSARLSEDAIQHIKRIAAQFECSQGEAVEKAVALIMVSPKLVKGGGK